MEQINILIFVAAFILALAAIYVLYALLMFQGNRNGKGSELQLTTKNILEQVEVLFEKGEYALVQLLATKYLDRVPNHRDVRQYLAQSYYKDKKYNNAMKQCLVILKREPNNIDTRKLLGDCYIQKQLLSKAIKEYEAIIEHRSKDKEVVRTLAELYRESEQIYSAISVYNLLSDLLEVKEEVADVQSILGELNEEVKDYPAAFEAYKARLGIYPTDIETNRKLTDLYIKLKNQPKAIDTLHYILSFTTEPKILLWAYEKLIDIYVETEEFEKAIEYSEKLVEVQGSDKFKVRNNIALYNIKLNKIDVGISILEELVLMSQSSYDVTTQLAQTYISCNEYQKALDKYLGLLDKASQKEAKNVHLLICELYIAWAIHCRENNKMEESYRKLDNAIEYNTLNPEIYFNKAVNCMIQNNASSAVDFLKIALEYDKQKDFHIKYYLKLSDAHHVLGNFFEEKKALNDLLKIDEKNPMGLCKTGVMYVTQHDTKNAEEILKKALQYDPDLIEAKYNLALIYESNNRDRAKELYIEILEQDPTHIEAKRALADLSISDF